MTSDGILWSKALQKKWLKSESEWSHRLGSDWGGVKVLGSGGFGVAGLWQYSSNGKYANDSRMIKEVVVKQADVVYDKNNNTLRSTGEGQILEMVSQIKSKHLVRQYGPLHKDVYENKEVVRIYLEYCPQGDLARLLARKMQRVGPTWVQEPPIEEEDIWSIFHCLSLGISAMDRGTENFTRSWQKNAELVHFDLKVDNVLLGYCDSEHPRIPVCKIADFGEATDVPKDPRQQRPYYNRGAWQIAPPENERLPTGGALQQPRHGTCSNIFQIGYVIYQLMMRNYKGEPATPRQIRVSNLNHRLQQGYTHGGRVETETTYSKVLKELVMECMMREPLLRPSSIDLQKRTEAGVKATRRTARCRSVGDLVLGEIEVVGPDQPRMFPGSWSRYKHRKSENRTQGDRALGSRRPRRQEKEALLICNVQ